MNSATPRDQLLRLSPKTEFQADYDMISYYPVTSSARSRNHSSAALRLTPPTTSDHPTSDIMILVQDSMHFRVTPCCTRIPEVCGGRFG